MRIQGYKQPEDMRRQESKQGHMNLTISGCNDARAQESTRKYKVMRMRGREDTSKCTGT